MSAKTSDSLGIFPRLPRYKGFYSSFDWHSVYGDISLLSFPFMINPPDTEPSHQRQSIEDAMLMFDKQTNRHRGEYTYYFVFSKILRRTYYNFVAYKHAENLSYPI
ncbi:hypothetical protein ACFW04_002554 [Cataglyphis niger]